MMCDCWVLSSDEKLLLYSAKQGKENALKALINFGTNFNVKSADGCNALHFAVKNNHTEVVKVLLEAGINVNSRDYSDNTPLHYAKESKIVDSLINHGADMCAVNNDGATPFLVACKDNKMAVFTRLLELGCDANASNILENHTTALHMCTEESRHDMMVHLLRFGVDVNLADANGNTALHLACIHSDMPSVEMLLSHGCDVNPRNNTQDTPLHFAAESAYELVSLLLSYGADIDSRNANHDSPVFKAVESSNMGSFLVLYGHGCDTQLPNKSKQTILHCAASVDNVDIVESILAIDVEPDTVDEFGRTPLSVAFINNSRNVLKLLLDYSCDINKISSLMRDYSGIGYSNIAYAYRHIIRLHVAKMYVSEDCLELVKITRKGIVNTELFEARCYSEVEQMKLLKIKNTFLSLYDILHKDIDKLCMCIQNSQVFRALEARYSGLTIYGPMIEYRFERAVRRRGLINDFKRDFYTHSVYLQKLPDSCLDKIICYLTNNDLRVFVNAFKLQF